MGQRTGTKRGPASLPLVETKLHAPPRRDQTIKRWRLVERLRATPEIKLTVVAAPAGSGKTTLLGAWREVEQETSPVAWMTLDEGDNDPVVLWSYVLAALRIAVPSLEVSAAPERVGASRLLDVVLPDLVNALTAAGEVALVLDDFHCLASGPARDSIAWFIKHAPPTFRLVLATRNEPGLPVASLRAHAALLELHAAELAFTRDEAESLLNDQLALELAAPSIDGLVERTEGWPAGLYLAALSLRAIDDREAFVRRFSGENRHVVDFLVDEVLEAHDPAIQDLMLRCSILERLSGPVCDAVLEQQGSAELLRRLSRSNLFLIPLDDRGEWYRFHHLFAQLLRVELERREPGLAATLHRRAFAWHRDTGSNDEAIEHALACGLFAEAAELISTVWAEYAGANRFATLVGWFERFPAAERNSVPLLLTEAWVYACYGRRDASEEAAEAAERLGSGEGPLPDGFSSLEGSLATLRGAVSWGDTLAGLESARRAAELEGLDSPWRPVVSFGLGVGLYFSGRFEEADQWLREAAEIAPTRERWLTLVNAVAFRSLVSGELGRADEQAVLADRALALAREFGTEDIDGEALMASAASLQSLGKLHDALRLFDRGLAALRLRGHPQALADSLLRKANLLQGMGRYDQADEAVSEARVVLESCANSPMLTQRLAAFEIARAQRRALSERELAILRMLNGTLSEADIGRELYLSHNTIHSHTRSIYRKLGVSSRSEALTHASQLGLI